MLETDYRALRGICTELPQRGKVSRSEIIKAVLTKVKQLESEVVRERAKDRARCHLQHARPPENARVVRSTACTLTGRCKTHPDLRVEQTVQTWGGGFASPEVQVLWDSEQSGASQRMPVHHPPTSGPRPYLPPSPPLPRRLWRPMVRSPARIRSPAPLWRPFHDSTRPVQAVPERRGLTPEFTQGMTPEFTQGTTQGTTPERERDHPRVDKCGLKTQGTTQGMTCHPPAQTEQDRPERCQQPQ